MFALEAERILGFRGDSRPVVAVGRSGEYHFPSSVGVMTANTDSAADGKLWIAGDGIHPIGNICFNNKFNVIVVTEKRLKVAMMLFSYPQKKQIQRIADVARVDVADMAYTRDGTLFAVLADAPSCTVSLYQVDQSSNKMALLIQTQKPHNHLYQRISFSPRSNQIVCASGGGHIAFWHHDTSGKQLQITDGKVTETHVRITCHVWLPSGEVAAGTTGGEIYSFPPQDGVGKISFQLPSLVQNPESTQGIQSMTISRHHIVIGTTDGFVLFVDHDFESVHFTVKTTVESIMSIQQTPEWHSFLVGGLSSIGIVHLPGYENPALRAEDFRRQSSRVATLHQGIAGEAVGVCHHKGTLATVVSKKGIALTYDYAKNSIVNQIHVGEEPLLVRKFGESVFAVTSHNGTVRFIDVSKPAASAVLLRAKVSDSPLVMCEANKSFNKLIASDGRTIASFAKGTDGDITFEGIIKINTAASTVAIAHVEAMGGFLMCQQGGDIGLYGPPFFDEAQTNAENGSKEIPSESLFVNSWRLDFPVLTLQVTSVHDEAINVLTHSLDKETKLYILDRTLSVERKDRESKAIKPQLTMKDHEKKGTQWAGLKQKYILSVAADGRLVLRDISGYLNRLAPTPPTKEKKDPLTTVVRHASLFGGITGCGVSDDENRIVTCGGDGFLVLWTLGRQQALPSTAFKVAVTTLNVEEEDKIFYSEKRRLQQEEFERLRHKEHRESIMKAIDRLRERLQQIRAENEAAAAEEKVPLQDFLIEQQKAQFEEQCAIAIQEMCDHEHFANLNRDYIVDIIKKECWDVMDVKLTRLRALSSAAVVNNFHERKTPSHNLVLLRKLKFLRLVEMREAQVRDGVKDLSELREPDPAAAQDNAKGKAGDGESDDPNGEPLLAVGKKTVELEALEDPSPFLYHPLSVFTRHRAIIQMTLLKGRTLYIRSSFNKTFSELINRKKQDLIKIEERNVRCRQVLKELDEQRPIFAPKFHKDEDPKHIFVVEDDEVPADKATDPDEKKRLAIEMEERQKWIERHGSDDSAEKALKSWMDGRLEKEVRTLDVKIDKPEFADETSEKFVPLEDRSDDQQRILKEYEKAVAKRIEEVNTRRAALQAEFTQLQKENADQAKKFDVLVADLFHKRLVAQQQCHEVELSQVKLAQNLLMQRERARLAKKMETHRHAISEQHARAARQTQLARNKANTASQRLEQLKEDEKNKEKNLRSFHPFTDAEFGDALVRIFTKKKPKKVDHGKKHDSKHGDQGPSSASSGATALSTSMDPFAFVEAEAEAKLRRYTDDPQFQLQKLDQGEIPSHIWDAFQKYRQERVDAERDIAILTDDLAECQADVEKCEVEEAELAEKERDAFEQFESFQRDSLKEQFDIDELYTFRQGQVEVEQAPVVTDYADAILINSSQIMRLNQLIRSSGAEKIDAMKEINEKKKEIRLIEWEMEHLSYGMETLEMELRHLHTLRVTKQMQEYINGGGEDHNEKERVKLIRHIEHVQKTMSAKIEDRRQQILKLKRAIKDKELENMLLLDQVSESKGIVDERKSIRDLQSAELDVERTNQLMKDMRVTRKLEDVAKAQQEEMLLLKKEIDRLRERTFPSFAVVSKRVVGNPDQK